MDNISKVKCNSIVKNRWVMQRLSAKKVGLKTWLEIENMQRALKSKKLMNEAWKLSGIYEFTCYHAKQCWVTVTNQGDVPYAKQIRWKHNASEGNNYS